MTMTYHRLLSHNSWNAPTWFRYFGVACATIGLTGSAISWVAIHRKHHKYADTKNDPHSPSFKGFVYCQWFSMFEEVELKYVTDLVRSRLCLFQHKYYFFLILAIAIPLYIIQPFSVIYVLLFPAFLLWNGGSSVVTFSHLFGRKKFETNDNSRNNWLLALLVWGEGWHNNHHKYPKRYSFRVEKWEIDIGAAMIFLITKLSKNK